MVTRGVERGQYRRRDDSEHWYETNLLNTAEQAMEFLAEVNEPNVKVHLDSYHMNIEERSLRQAVLTCGDKLGYVHVAGTRASIQILQSSMDDFFKSLRHDNILSSPRIIIHIKPDSDVYASLVITHRGTPLKSIE